MTPRRSRYERPDDLSDDALIEGYINFLTVEDFSAKTVERRNGTLRSFVRRIRHADLARGVEPVEQVLVEAELRDIDLFLGRREKSAAPLSPAARRAYLNDLRAFYRWAGPRYGLTDPTVGAKRIRVPGREPKPVPDEAVIHVLAYLGSLRTKGAASTALAILLAYHMGLRCFECCEVTRGDVLYEDTDSPVLHFIGKGEGGKEAFQPIPEAMYEHLLIDVPADHHYVDSDPTNLTHAVIRAFRAAGHPGWSLHKVRHSFGTRVYAHTRDLVHTMEMLRHSNIATTQGYVKSMMDDRAHASLNSMPNPLAS